MVDKPAVEKDKAKLEADKPEGRVAVGGAISHPSVAAIVTADPGGRAGPDIPTMMVHAKDHFSDKQLDPIQIKAAEPVIPPIPKLVNPHADPSVKTASEEQIERSAQNERDGMPNWPMNNDDRRRPEAAGQNPGIVPGAGFSPAPKGSS